MAFWPDKWCEGRSRGGTGQIVPCYRRLPTLGRARLGGPSRHLGSSLPAVYLTGTHEQPVQHQDRAMAWSALGAHSGKNLKAWTRGNRKATTALDIENLLCLRRFWKPPISVKRRTAAAFDERTSTRMKATLVVLGSLSLLAWSLRSGLLFDSPFVFSSDSPLKLPRGR